MKVTQTSHCIKSLDPKATSNVHSELSHFKHTPKMHQFNQFKLHQEKKCFTFIQYYTQKPNLKFDLVLIRPQWHECLKASEKSEKQQKQKNGLSSTTSQPLLTQDIVALQHIKETEPYCKRPVLRKIFGLYLEVYFFFLYKKAFLGFTTPTRNQP